MDARAIWRAPTDLGVTLPLLISLVEQYSDRRRRELAEDATASAVATHDPQGIERLRGHDDPGPEEDSEFAKPDWGTTHG